jgi:ABC-type nitrate/sulfonate/bicarbonate transport system ATPase subunit
MSADARQDTGGDRSAATRSIPKLELRSVGKVFEDKASRVHVLHELDAHVGRGEFVSFIGPSGCGKSTMFNIIAGLVSPSMGEILLDGRPVTGHGEHFAYMPQKDLLFPWRRVIDNTTLGLEVQGMKRKEARERAAPLFEVFGLEGFEFSYPWQLSGGMRQRGALLRTVVQGRSVLLHDEPFGALDSLTRTEMQEWLTGVWEQFHWTVVLITHDIREAVFLSDRVYVLTARPAKVRAVEEVRLPRPRALSVVGEPEFWRLEASLLQTLREESRRSHFTDGEPPDLA